MRYLLDNNVVNKGSDQVTKIIDCILDICSLTSLEHLFRLAYLEVFYRDEKVLAIIRVEIETFNFMRTLKGKRIAIHTTR